jgi:ATP-dependent DNA helicase DinG
LTELVRDTKLAYFEEAGDLPEAVEAVDGLQRAVLDLRLGLGIASYRGIWAAVREESNVLSAVEHLGGALRELDVILALLAQRGKGLENCWKRCKSLYAALQAYLEPQSPEHLQWFETYTQSFILRLTPLEVAEQFRGHMERHPAAWIFTSATLSVDNDFSHFTRRLGLVDPATLVLDSPFDYRHNALLYVPPGLPPPNSEAYLEAFLSAVIPVLEASHGRAFVLFTSHRALSIAAETLREQVDYPLLVQGEAAQNVLLERFRALDNAVLLGTSSFWEGVDVRGEALSCVIIDRLPFASPSDPVMQAKIEALRRRDDNPFVQHQLPLAVIALRQGVGRLIRDTHDRGVLVIGDNRLLTKSYGRVFLNSLPPVPITRDLGRVHAFFS